MKFAHFSDCHLGGWKEPQLRDLGLLSFRTAMQECIKEYVGFILIAGDLFDVALPSVDVVKEVTSVLRELKEHDIPVYVIPGSHDYSPSGKTMIDVLEKAGLLENVAKPQFTIDRTGIKIVGVHGRKGALEREDYARLDKNPLEDANGFKIFLFHTLLEEMKPPMFQYVGGLHITHLPKRFQYYAGGHPHMQKVEYVEGYGMVAYPGPTFPNNFKELEELQCGRYLLVDVGEKFVVQHRKIPLKDVCAYTFSAEGKTPELLEKEMRSTITNVHDKIVLIRVEGCLAAGKSHEVNWKALQEHMQDAYVVLKNTSKLTTKEYQEITVDRNVTVEELEAQLLATKQHEQDVMARLMHALNVEKAEGERNLDFEARVMRQVKGLLAVE